MLMLKEVLSTLTEMIYESTLGILILTGGNLQNVCFLQIFTGKSKSQSRYIRINVVNMLEEWEPEGNRAVIEPP